MPDYTLIFPYSALHFDFSRSGTGSTFITDKFGHKAKLKIEVTYPWRCDPSPHNLRVTGATLLKNRQSYKLDTRSIQIQEPAQDEDELLLREEP